MRLSKSLSKKSLIVIAIVSVFVVLIIVIFAFPSSDKTISGYFKGRWDGGYPVEGIKIYFLDINNNRIVTTSTDINGFYETDIPKGDYVIVVGKHVRILVPGQGYSGELIDSCLEDSSFCDQNALETLNSIKNETFTTTAYRCALRHDLVWNSPRYEWLLNCRISVENPEKRIKLDISIPVPG